MITEVMWICDEARGMVSRQEREILQIRRAFAEALLPPISGKWESAF